MNPLVRNILPFLMILPSSLVLAGPNDPPPDEEEPEVCGREKDLPTCPVGSAPITYSKWACPTTYPKEFKVCQPVQAPPQVVLNCQSDLGYAYCVASPTDQSFSYTWSAGWPLAVYSGPGSSADVECVGMRSAGWVSVTVRSGSQVIGTADWGMSCRLY